MVLNPDKQRLAQKEMDLAIGDETLPLVRHRNDLRYLNAIVKETLRWHPPLPIGNHRPCKIPSVRELTPDRSTPFYGQRRRLSWLQNSERDNNHSEHMVRQPISGRNTVTHVPNVGSYREKKRGHTQRTTFVQNAFSRRNHPWTRTYIFLALEGGTSLKKRCCTAGQIFPTVSVRERLSEKTAYSS